MEPLLIRSVLSEYCSCYVFFLTESPVNFVVFLNKYEWKASFLSSVIPKVFFILMTFTYFYYSVNDFEPTCKISYSN